MNVMPGCGLRDLNDGGCKSGISHLLGQDHLIGWDKAGDGHPPHQLLVPLAVHLALHLLGKQLGIVLHACHRGQHQIGQLKDSDLMMTVISSVPAQ